MRAWVYAGLAKKHSAAVMLPGIRSDRGCMSRLILFLLAILFVWLATIGAVEVLTLAGKYLATVITPG